MDIHVEGLTKQYKVHEKNIGLKASVKSLFKRKYNTIDAVNDIGFTIEGKGIVGFIGPNGSGKTTTLKMISGLLYPTSGTIKIGGFTPYERDHVFLKQLGFVMGQKGQLWWDLPILDSYDLLIDIYQCDKASTLDYINHLAERLNIKSCLKQPVKMLSLGQRMKAELIGAILHKPTLLLLDEPTIGLDIQSARDFRKIIKEEVENRNMSVILSSHIMDDIQELCKKIIIINNGRLVYDDYLSNCYEQYLFKKQIQVKFKKAVTKNELLFDDRIVSFSPHEVWWEVERDQVAEVSYKLMQHFSVDDLTINEIPISEVIEYITNGGEKNEKVS